VSPSLARRRQGPCPCGSRRSLAACCLPWEEALRRLYSRLTAFALTPDIRRHEAAAAAIFWNTERPLQPGKGQTADESVRFLEWFLHDYPRHSGAAPLIAEFADAAPRLDAEEETLLFDLLLTPFRAYEVTEVRARQRVVMEDLLTGEGHAIGPLGLAQLPIRSDVVICRLVPVGRLVRPGAALVMLPGLGREELLAYLRTAYRLSRPRRHVALEDFLDNAVHLYHHFFLLRGRELGGRALETFPNAPFEAGGVLYRGTDLARILACLDRLPELERETRTAGEVAYVWLDPEHFLARASVQVSPGAVTVRAETKRELSRAKVFIETSLQGLVQPADQPGNAEGDHPWIEAPRPRSRAAGKAFLQRRIEGWMDIPSPRLDDRTPREMCRTRSGRLRVEVLLLELERSLGRLKRLGRASADVGKLREHLGLPAAVPTSLRRPR
jgi:hypothetical protein